MTNKTLKDVVWGSDEFYELLRKREHVAKVEEEKRIVDEMLSQITTTEASRYLIGKITGH